MFSHLTIGSNDMSRAQAFYDAVLKTLGHEPLHVYEGEAVAYGKPDDMAIWVMVPLDGKPATVGNGITVGLLAPNRSAGDAFHAAALANGGSDEGAPGLRPHYHEHYYGAYVRDPDGNKLCAACHQPE